MSESERALWEAALAPKTVRVWHYLQEHDNSPGQLLLLDMVRDLGLSKTAIRAAVGELREHGFLTTEVGA